MTIVSMGRFTAIGMREPVYDPSALVINTCSNNDTAQRGDFRNWTWSNPTNRAIRHYYVGERAPHAPPGDADRISAVSVECLWQGTKIFEMGLDGGVPDPLTLAGDWRRGKKKRPLGAWAGFGRPLINSPGDARRRIYIPAFRDLVLHWTEQGLEHECNAVNALIAEARAWSGPVYLRDWDVGRGLDQNGSMSHAWVLATWLNTGAFPQ